MLSLAPNSYVWSLLNKVCNSNGPLAASHPHYVNAPGERKQKQTTLEHFHQSQSVPFFNLMRGQSLKKNPVFFSIITIFKGLPANAHGSQSNSSANQGKDSESI